VVAAPAGLTDLADMLHRPNPEMRWLKLLGMTPLRVVHDFGPARETLVLFERLKSDGR